LSERNSNAPRELTVRLVMDRSPAAVAPETPIRDVLALMNQRRIGSILVVEEAGRLAGIFTERDLLKRVVEADASWRDLPVSDWMTTDPHTIRPDVGWDEAVGMMGRLRVRHLPVIEDERLIGIVSTRLLMARRTEFLNRQIEDHTAELRRANESLMSRDSEILQYLRTTGRLQMRVMIPDAPPDWSEMKWAVHYAPLDHLGGDYYDFSQPDPNHLGFLIADASGHSIPAAFVAMLAHFAFKEVSEKTDSPGKVLSRMNRRLHEVTEERFVTAFYGMFDRRTRVFRFASAGHPPPLHFDSRNGVVRKLSAQGFVLGIMPDEVYTEREVVLEPGDKICFYTDGIMEARNEIGELFGLDRLMEYLALHGRESAEEILRNILFFQRPFSGTESLDDDLTAVVVEMV